MILWTVRWYLQFAISCCDVALMLRDKQLECPRRSLQGAHYSSRRRLKQIDPALPLAGYGIVVQVRPWFQQKHYKPFGNKGASSDGVDCPNDTVSA